MITTGRNATKLTITDTIYGIRTHTPGASVSYVLRIGKLRITLGKVCRLDWMRVTRNSPVI